MFSLILFYSDNYLTISRSRDPNDNRTRFLRILKELPIELQMIVCYRLFHLNKEIIPSKLYEPCLFQFIQQEISNTE